MNAQSILIDLRQSTPAEKGKPLSDQIESALVAQARRGDKAAIGQLYRQHAPQIYGYIARRVGDPALADDLTSEVFLCALEGLSQFEYRGISISAWLYRIAHDRVADNFRRQARTPAVPLIDELGSGEERVDQAVEARLKVQQLDQAVERLTADQQQVILLRFVAGLKLHEIAYVMGKSTDAIKMLQLRALARLRQLVAQAR